MQEPTSGPAGLRIAIVDRDTGFLQVLTKRLDRIGCEHRVSAGPLPPAALVRMRASAVVVDLALFGPAGWDWLERVCDELPALGVVVCTPQSTVAQRVRGLRLGADDWVTKPCHPEELIARVEAAVRARRGARTRTREDAPLVAGALEIRRDQFQAFVGGQSAELTRREFELIELLAEARGRVLEREEIYRRVWGYEMARGDRSVDVFVRKLRQKLERVSPGRRYIHTHFGVGYRFAVEGPEGELAEAGPAAGELIEEPVADVAFEDDAADAEALAGLGARS